MEDRLARDIEAYLNSNNYVLAVDTSLEKKATYSLIDNASVFPQTQSAFDLPNAIAPQSSVDIPDYELPGLVSVPLAPTPPSGSANSGQNFAPNDFFIQFIRRFFCTY